MVRKKVAFSIFELEFKSRSPVTLAAFVVRSPKGKKVSFLKEKNYETYNRSERKQFFASNNKF